MASIQIPAFTEPDVTDGMIRYNLMLCGPDGKQYDFIIDLPTGTERTDVDVWLLNSDVGVGDTPADGFATFVPRY